MPSDAELAALLEQEEYRNLLQVHAGTCSSTFAVQCSTTVQFLFAPR